VPIFFGEEDVVVLAAVEGRVDIDEIDGLVLDVLAKDGEVIAVIELVLLHCRAILAGMSRGRNLIVGAVPAGLGSYFIGPIPGLTSEGYLIPPLRGWGRVIAGSTCLANSKSFDVCSWDSHLSQRTRKMGHPLLGVLEARSKCPDIAFRSFSMTGTSVITCGPMRHRS